MLAKDTVVCIRALDYSETSQIVTVFGKATGKVTAIAKGSKRPKSAFGGPIEMFSYGQIVFTETGGEKLATLTEFEQQASVSGLAKTLFALNCSYFAAELINGLTDEYDPHPQLFDYLLQFLQNIQQAKDKDTALKVLIPLQLNLLKEIGLQPVFDACVNCKTRFTTNWPETYFSSSANGFICKDCEASFPDKTALSKASAHCFSHPKQLSESQQPTLKELEKVLTQHFTELLGYPPKMAKHISGAFRKRG